MDLKKKNTHMQKSKLVLMVPVNVKRAKGAQIYHPTIQHEAGH